MKESAKIFTVIMVIIFGFAAIAKNARNIDDEKVQLVPCKTGTVKLVYLKDANDDVNVTMFNEEGELLFKEAVKSEKGFVNVYDMHQYGSGHYTFRIEDNAGTIDRQIYFEEDRNVMLCEMGDTGKYRLVMDEASDVDVSIMNKDNQLLYSDNISAKGSVSKLYNVAKFTDNEEGELSFIIKDDNDFLKIATF